jgi:perosamine synthetase
LGIRHVSQNFLLSTEKRPNVKIAKPFNDEAIESSVLSILRSGMLVQGEFVKQFESRLSEYIGCRYVIAVNSGTAALQLALQTAGSRKKSGKGEVITSPLSFAATANAAIANGFTPIFADVDPETFNIDPSNVEERISDSTVALEPVDVYGLPADLQAIDKIASKNEIRVVEDAAEAIGAMYQGKKIGNVSNVSCFSTYATKNLHTGEGGFITTNDDEMADQIRMARNQGQSSRYNQKTMGYNFRMLEFCAAIGTEQISQLDKLNGKRREHAHALTEGLQDVESLGFQRVDDPSSHAWYMFAVTLDERVAGISRDKLVQKLRDEGIEADVSWPVPIHLQPFYREAFGYKEGDFPMAEKLCRSVFQLPIQPYLTEDEVQRIISTVKSILPS